MNNSNDIVVVDDQTSALRLLCDLLAAEGYVVRPATSGEAALAAVLADPPELVLLDIRMPGGIDGYEVCRRLQAQEATRAIPLLLLSGSTSPEEHSHGFNLGAVDFITKPFQRDELLARVRTHLELSRLRNNLAAQVQERTAQLQTANARLQAELVERSLLEERLRHAEKMEAIGQLAGGVAHDFNNQLAGIIGFAELLGNRLEEPALGRFVERILTAARRAADLTQKLLAFSRKSLQATTPVNLHDTINEVIGLLQHSLDRRISIALRLEAASAMTSGDASQLQSALLNLALNARDAMPTGGELAFTTSETSLTAERAAELEVAPGPFLAVTVADTGIGISPEHRKRLFEPFVTTKEPGKGTGLGLASVYGTVKSHQGAIVVSSEVGRGTTVTLYLPLLRTVAAAASPLLPTVPGESAHILLVDDEAVVRELGAALLTELGYQATSFSDGVEALAYYREHWQQVRLVVLDLNMPRLGSNEVFLALRQINPTVRVLLASGFGPGNQIQELLEAGALDFLPKPFGLAELSRKVAGALRMPQKRKA